MTRADKLREALTKVQSMLQDQYTISDREMCSNIESMASKALREDYENYGPKGPRTINSELL